MVPLKLWVATAALSTLATAQTYGNGTSTNGTNSTAGAIYKNPRASVEDRIADLISRMTIEDKMAQLMQGDITNWMNATDNSFNYTGLVENMKMKQGAFYVGYPVPQQWISQNVKRAQDYLIQNTTLGIPALVQTEGIHGFLIGNATIFNSPLAYSCSFNPELVNDMAKIIATESLALGVNQLFVSAS
jgi:beta-glucosidase